MTKQIFRSILLPSTLSMLCCNNEKDQKDNPIQWTLKQITEHSLLLLWDSLHEVKINPYLSD